MDGVSTTQESASSPESASVASTIGETNAAAPVDGEAKKEESETKRPARKKIHSEIEISEREPVDVNLRTLLQAGVHFGHQTARWSPAMAPFIHSARNGIHIVNLPHTVAAWDKARAAIVELASRGGNILFVGTKKQASDAIAEEARRCGAFYVSHRWLGGMITNFQTIRKSIDRLQKIETTLVEEDAVLAEGGSTRFTKKERLMMSREREKLELSLGGIRTMVRAPQMMFVVDIKREDIAIREAARLDIPVVALVDTNCDPRIVDHPIPSNDDGTRAIRLFCSAVADAMMEGKAKLADRRVASAAVKTEAGVSTNPTFKPVDGEEKKAPKVEKKKPAASAKKEESA